MNIQKVTASVRYSKALGDGEHKTIELGAEAQVAPGEPWQQAQDALYKALGTQLRALWASNGSKAQPAPTAAPKAPRPPKHYCQRHGVAFQRHAKGGRVWYSHKTKAGDWCKEQEQKAA